MEFDRPFTSFGTWFGNWVDDQDRGGAVAPGSRSAEQTSYQQSDRRLRNLDAGRS